MAKTETESTEIKVEEAEPMDNVSLVEDIIKVADVSCKEQCVVEEVNLMEPMQVEKLESKLEVIETKKITEPRIKRKVEGYLCFTVSKKYEPKPSMLKAKVKRGSTRREIPLDSTIIYTSPRGPRHSERVKERMGIF